MTERLNVYLNGQMASILDWDYASERYDRVQDGKTVRRLLQEDFCQAMGVPSEGKYESNGGPSAVRSFRFLRDGGFGFSKMGKFVDTLVFNFLEELSDAGHHSSIFRAIIDQSQRRASQLREYGEVL